MPRANERGTAVQTPLGRARWHIEQERLRNLRRANEMEDAGDEHNTTVHHCIAVGLEQARNIIDREVERAPFA